MYNKLFWIQSFAKKNNDNSNNNNNNNRNNDKLAQFKSSHNCNRIYGLIECNIGNKFSSSVKQLYVDTCIGSQFSLINLKPYLIVWNLSKCGASGDIFGIYKFNENEKEKENKDNNDSTFLQIKGKVFKIENSLKWQEYNFNSRYSDIESNNDLVRDINKLCVINNNSNIVFCGGCVLCTFDISSIKSNKNKMNIILDSKNRQICELVSNDVEDAYHYFIYFPINTLPMASKESNTQWFADYTPFANNSIIARWLNNKGKHSFAIWKQTKQNNNNNNNNNNSNNRKWNVLCNNEYDFDIWQESILKCPMWNDRLNTILLCCQLSQDQQIIEQLKK